MVGELLFVANVELITSWAFQRIFLLVTEPLWSWGKGVTKT